jgi:hypothetical protein
LNDGEARGEAPSPHKNLVMQPIDGATASTQFPKTSHIVRDLSFASRARGRLGLIALSTLVLAGCDQLVASLSEGCDTVGYPAFRATVVDSLTNAPPATDVVASFVRPDGITVPMLVVTDRGGSLVLNGCCTTGSHLLSVVGVGYEPLIRAIDVPSTGGQGPRPVEQQVTVKLRPQRAG